MQGFNMGRYVPPSTLDPSLANASSQKRQPRWQKPAQNTVRFELPVAIWCSACPESSVNKLIGQGVRFNADKKRVGNYFSTPVFAFRIKHTPCGSWIEIRTDPKRAREAEEGKAEKSDAWVVTEGARKRDYGTADTSGQDESIIWQSRDPHGGLSEEKFEARDQVLSDFERRKKIKIDNTDRIAELRMESDRYGRDPVAWNKKARSQFRERKKKEEAEERPPDLRMQTDKAKSVKEIGSMLQKNTREQRLSDVWSTPEPLDQPGKAAVIVRPKTESTVAESAREDIFGKRKTLSQIKSASDEALVEYEDEDW